MAYRMESLATGEYFHIYSRGNNKQEILHDRRDYIRFLFCILYFQSPLLFTNLSRYVDYYEKYGSFPVTPETLKDVVKKRFIELINFAIMPNHFHLTLYAKEENGISKYMQRVLNSYAKYVNTKYSTKHFGHLFQSQFKAVRQQENTQLLHLSAYIHKNPKELPAWKGKEFLYPWSSLMDYTGENRFDELLSTDIILGQFKDKKEYEDFVVTSTAKETEMFSIVEL